MNPKRMPPTADIASVTVPRSPAVASFMVKYARSCPMAMAYSMKSMASSIHPSLAAASTRHCAGVTVRYHGVAGAYEAEMDTASGMEALGPRDFTLCVLGIEDINSSQMR